MRRVKPQSSTTFEEYVENELKPKIFSHFSHANRVDVVFDQYKSDSIKTGTRDDRGSGKRRKVAPNVRIPGDWKEFLSCSQNRTEFFPLISEQLLRTADLPAGKKLFATMRDVCGCTDTEQDLESISPCSHEEADTRMFLHMFDAALCGHKRILIEANDTDVIVIGMRALR